MAAGQLTPARIALDARQKAEPPLYPRNSSGRDRVQALAHVLQLPAGLAKLQAEDIYVVGEIGSYIPDARTVEEDDGTYVVEITSGMMDFLYAVGRAMAGVTVVYGRDGRARNAQAMELKGAAALAADVFRQWRTICQPGFWDSFRRRNRIRHSDFELSLAAGDMAETLVSAAELFILCHELGHVALDRKLVTSPQPLEELQADSVGLDIYFPPVRDRLGDRFALAGMAFAIRVLSSLERQGAKFSTVYPPAAERLAMLQARARKLYPSQQMFDEAATIMVANLDLFDDIDNDLEGRPPALTMDPWRRLVGVLAALQSLVTEKRPTGVWLHMFRRAMDGLEVSEQRRIARTLSDYYLGDDEVVSFYDERLFAEIAAALRLCLPELTDGERQLFDLQ